MAKRPSFSGSEKIKSKPKCTRQGHSKNTKYSATARNKKKKAYVGQGKS